MRVGQDDRRVAYTKNALRSALIALLEDRRIGKVSVTDLCQKADINRTTFYAHYSNPGELLECMEREMLADILKFVERYEFADDAPSAHIKMARMFEYIRSNAALCRTLLGPNGNMSIHGVMSAIAEHPNIPRLRAEHSHDKETLDCILLYTVSGSIGVVRRWIESGLKKPAEDMAEMLLTLINHGSGAFT